MLVIGGVDIGNRQDIGQRVLDAISSYKVIVVENLSVFDNLCNSLKIYPNGKILEYFSPMDAEEEQKIVKEIIDYLDKDVDVLMLSDDGMPGIADPGGLIVDMAHRSGYKVSVLPGPSVVSTLPAVLGVDSRSFTFEDSIPPNRSERLIFFQKLYSEGRGVIIIIKNRRDENFTFKEILKDVELVFPKENMIGIGVNMTMDKELIFKTKVSEVSKKLSAYNFSQKDFISLYIDCR
jgi:16S rRNA (cytidine1402-2'-O)-methyltransferase